MSVGEPLRIAIVGAGVAGVLVALRIHRQTSVPTRVDLFEAGTRVAGGPAYDWRNPIHLLNGEADHLSVHEDEPNDFVDWLRAAPEAAPFLSAERPIDRQFVPRFLFSDYARERFERAQNERGPCELRVHFSSRVAGLTLRERDALVHVGERVSEVDHVVLASGNPAPRTLFGGLSGVTCIDNPWQPEWTRHVQSGPVLMVGSGQTMVDAALALESSGHDGELHAVSRRGLVPATHREDLPVYALEASRFPKRLSAMTRFVRREIALAEQRGVDWRAVLNAVRPLAGNAWPGLSDTEKRRFLRHLSAYWWSYRQRVAPAVGARLEFLIESGRLRVHRGRVRRIDLEDGVASVAIDAGVTPRRIRANTLINCTGPDFDCRASQNEVIRALLLSGQARRHPSGSGLDVNAELSVVAADGRPSRRLRALGAVSRGAFLEALAIRDLRRQSVVLVRALLREPAALDARLAGSLGASRLG